MKNFPRLELAPRKTYFVDPRSMDYIENVVFAIRLMSTKTAVVEKVYGKGF